MLVWDHWHIEPSSICTLKCPRCPRVEVPDTLLNRQLTLAFFQQQLGVDTVKRIRKITFCGNDGDPIYCRDLVSICEWIKSVNPNIHLIIITNGSHKTDDWWRSLSQVLDHRDEVNWSLDGWDQISNSLYRINCDWSSIMQGIDVFTKHNQSTYRVWATIAFRFNQDSLDKILDKARSMHMDMWQLTKSTKFGSHYPDTYGRDDPLCPDRDLVSSTHRFQRVVTRLTDRPRPSDHMKSMFWQRAQELKNGTQHASLCKVGNKGVFLDSQGRFYPCCWTANRYLHNQTWHALARDRFNLYEKSFQDIMADPFWTGDFLRFDSVECQTKCTRSQLESVEHCTEW